MLGIIPCKYTLYISASRTINLKLTHAPHSYSKSIIHDEKQYQIAENVFGAGYKGGENTRFYQEKAELMDDIHAEAFRASIICMMLPYRTNQGGRAPRIENPIDITGKLHPTLYAETDIPEGKFFYDQRSHHHAARVHLSNTHTARHLCTHYTHNRRSR